MTINVNKTNQINKQTIPSQSIFGPISLFSGSPTHPNHPPTFKPIEKPQAWECPGEKGQNMFCPLAQVVQTGRVHGVRGRPVTPLAKDVALTGWDAWGEECLLSAFLWYPLQTGIQRWVPVLRPETVMLFCWCPFLLSRQRRN